MTDPNWKQMIVDIHGDVREMKPKVDKAVEVIEDHEHRIESLELDHAKRNGYREAKEKFYKRHPIKTGVAIGGVSLTTVFTIIGIVLKTLGIV